MTLQGTIINGQIVFNPPVSLPEGAVVRVEINPRPVEDADWIKRLRSAATDCGVSLSNEAVSSEGIYD